MHGGVVPSPARQPGVATDAPIGFAFARFSSAVVARGAVSATYAPLPAPSWPGLLARPADGCRP
jgi:hypothetical protein